METKFKLSEQNYRYLFENASDAMWVHDIQGNIVDANKAFERLTGYTWTELIGMNVATLLPGKESLNIAEEVRIRLLSRKDIEQPYEQQLLRKDGETRIIRIATSPVIIDDEVKGFEHTARDVTKEKSTEDILSKIIDGSPIPSFVIDKQHKVTHWNTAIESLSGVSRQEIVETDEQWRAFYNEKRPAMADLIVEGVSAEAIEAYYQGKCEKSHLIDGAYEAEDFFPSLSKYGKWLRFNASPIKNESGEITGAIETLQDISEEKQLQENMHFYVQLITQAQEDERKRIARDLHDDVAQSLLLIIQRLDTTLSSTRPRLSASLKDNIEAIHSQAVETLQILRHYARDLRPPILDDLGLVATLEWMAEDLTKNYGIDTHAEILGNEQSLPAELQLLLFRIAQEALTNIRKHANASRAWITLEFDDKAVLTVKDNGKGFELPQRIGDLASAARLGLVGMQERARLMGGSLTLQSELGQGTTVTVEVPI